MRMSTYHHVHDAEVRAHTRDETGWMEVPLSEDKRSHMYVYFTDPAHARRLADDLRAMANRWEAAVGGAALEKAVTA